jgi:hypothetical protein
MAERLIKELRSLETALAELQAKYQNTPTTELARMIEQLTAEVGIRKRPAKRKC